MKTFEQLCASIVDFFRARGLKVDPAPAVVLDPEPCSRFDPFVPTGHYDYTSQTVTLRIDQRQAKDILRSFCHELVHHSQFLSRPEEYAAFDKSGDLDENPVLEEYEREAYEKGNVLFRKWTEQVQREGMA